MLSLPLRTRLFLCHDSKPAGRDPHAWESTVQEQRETNVHIRDGVSENHFVAMRKARDADLPAPGLLMPSIQVNIRAGRFPPAEANGVRYMKVPVKVRTPAAAEAVAAGR